MNIHNIKLLRDHIAKLKDDEWNINTYNKCFCGHIINLCILKYGSDYGNYYNEFLLDLINSEWSSELIMPTNWRTRVDITIPVAVSILDNLITTGKVDWDYAIANPAKLDEVM